MYARKVDDRVLTFGVSGLLWGQSLIMYDLETRSYWSQILGQAMEGPLKGKKLTPIPSVLATWQEWSQRHPDGTVVTLNRNIDAYDRSLYAGHLHRYVLGIGDGDKKAKAWALDQLARDPVRNDRWQDRPVVVVFDSSSFMARLFDATVDGKTLTFHLSDGQLEDDQTGSRWDPITGEAVAGPLQGKRLTLLPTIVSDLYSWFLYYPDSEKGTPIPDRIVLD